MKAGLCINIFHHQGSEDGLVLSQVSVVTMRMTKISNLLLNIEEKKQKSKDKPDKTALSS